MRIKQQTIACPHCGHHQRIELDATAGDQEFYDDCRICCNPIHIRLHVDEANRKIELRVDGDDEQLY